MASSHKLHDIINNVPKHTAACTLYNVCISRHKCRVYKNGPSESLKFLYEHFNPNTVAILFTATQLGSENQSNIMDASHKFS